MKKYSFHNIDRYFRADNIRSGAHFNNISFYQNSYSMDTIVSSTP